MPLLSCSLLVQSAGAAGGSQRPLCGYPQRCVTCCRAFSVHLLCLHCWSCPFQGERNTPQKKKNVEQFEPWPCQSMTGGY